MNCVVLLLLVASIKCEVTEEKEEDYVIVGTAANWDEHVNSKSNVLVEFYAPWCGHCQHLEPEYKKAASQLMKEGADVKLVKIDATIEKDLAAKHGVRGYPTLKFFKNGIPKDYDGGRSQREIVNWVNNKLGPPARELANAVEVEDFRNSEAAVVIGFFDDRESNLAKQYILVASEVEDEHFGIADIKAGADLGVTKPTIIVLKKFDEEKTEYTGDGNYVSIRRFIQQATTPLLITFNSENQKRIFGGDTKIYLFLIAKNDDPAIESLKKIMRELAVEYRGILIFVYCDLNDINAKRLTDYLGATEGPTIRVLSLATDDEKKYIFSGEITSINVINFINSVRDGKIDPFYKSAEEPKDWDKEPVKVLVGKSFDRVVNAKDTNAFVEFYAPWCGACKSMAPIWDELGAKVQNNKNLIIAKVDSIENEVAGIDIRSFPTIKFFPANSDKIVDYKGERDLDNFLKFLKEQLGDQFVEGSKNETKPKEPSSKDDPKAEEQKKKEPTKIEL